MVYKKKLLNTFLFTFKLSEINNKIKEIFIDNTMESSTTEIVDLRRRLERVENELRLKKTKVSFILIIFTDIFKLIII